MYKLPAGNLRTSRKLTRQRQRKTLIQAGSNPRHLQRQVRQRHREVQQEGHLGEFERFGASNRRRTAAMSFLASPSSSSASLSRMDNPAEAADPASTLRGRQLAAVRDMLTLDAASANGSGSASAMPLSPALHSAR